MKWEPNTRRNIPAGEGTAEVEVVSLAPHGEGYGVSKLAYLQYVRSGILRVFSPTGRAEDSHFTTEYLANVADYARSLADRVEQALGGQSPDAIIEVPSSRDLNEPYTHAVRERFPDAMDLTPHIRRFGNVKAGEEATAADVLSDTIAVDVPSLSGVGTLVLVDDVLEAGKTTGAVVARLRESGLPAECRILLAIPLVVHAPSAAG